MALAQPFINSSTLTLMVTECWPHNHRFSSTEDSVPLNTLISQQPDGPKNSSRSSMPKPTSNHFLSLYSLPILYPYANVPGWIHMKWTGNLQFPLLLNTETTQFSVSEGSLKSHSCKKPREFISLEHELLFRDWWVWDREFNPGSL